MSPEIAEIVAPFLVILGLGTMIVIGMKVRYNYLAKIRAPQPPDESVTKLAESVEILRTEVESLRDEHGELFERIEFAERLLTRERDAGALPGDAERLG